MMSIKNSFVAAVACLTPFATSVTISQPARAAEPSASMNASADADIGDSSASAPGAATGDDGAARSSTPWIKRHAPAAMTLELGVFGGALFPPKNHELYVPDNTNPPDNGHRAFATVAPDIGARLGFYPLSFLGVEVEGAVMPTRTSDDNPATIFGFRGHALAQLPYRVTPFALLGYGLLGASGSGLEGAANLGTTDIDPAFHFGGGVKFYVNRWIGLRLDVRDSVSSAHRIEGGRAHYPELLLGLSVLLNRPARELVDTDGDGLYDPGQGLEVEDQCPREAGPRENSGCPWGDRDRDGVMDNVDKCPDRAGPADNDGCPWDDRDRDGFTDNVDKCPDEPGVKPDGCPVGDRDGDGVLDDADRCVDVPGPADNQGCPFQDTDGDGIIDAKDKCVKQPETRNGFEDDDGCPDTLPKKLKQYTGVIKGIYFDVNKDTIKQKSYPVLNRAVSVLNEFKQIRVEISGHTDSTGAYDHNMDLSRRRAESVKRYLVESGVDSARIETVGYGPDKPIADNGNAKGRAKNRRIEFRLLTK